MSSQRIDRVNELLQREIALCLYRIQFDEPLDLARITVAKVICAPDLRKARVLISVLSDEHGIPDPVEVTRTLNRKRKDIQQLMASHVILKYTPHLQFIVDDTLMQADRVLDILDHLPPPADED
ncbi:MAG: 30S ribosome-binding factor RbfA [Verrucomicrobia bacterium]|nr:30S ribosome-binding factor RbfA [Verrucomicrobiota bacterium]MCH8528969.1 30S ribosome-binding factor RbfA [Kiritimatiellia bacterium]